VLAAAVELFGTRGWAATGMRDVGIHHRNAGVLLALRPGAASDRELARLLRELEQRRGIDVEQGVSLATGRAGTRQECDGLWAVFAVEVYHLLTALRGWTPQQYETWLADVIDRLLRDPGQRT
jgi:hypothetical protein